MRCSWRPCQAGAELSVRVQMLARGLQLLRELDRAAKCSCMATRTLLFAVKSLPESCCRSARALTELAHQLGCVQSCLCGNGLPFAFATLGWRSKYKSIVQRACRVSALCICNAAAGVQVSGMSPSPSCIGTERTSDPARLRRPLQLRAFAHALSCTRRKMPPPAKLAARLHGWSRQA